MHGLKAAILASTLAVSGCHTVSINPRLPYPDPLINPFSREDYAEKNISIYACGGLGGNLLDDYAEYLEEKLHAKKSILVSYTHWRECENYIDQDIKENRKIILLRHSLGGPDAIRIAHMINKKSPNTRVMMMLFDSGHLGKDPETILLQILAGGVKKIPSNVDVLINYYGIGHFNGEIMEKNVLESKETHIINRLIPTWHNSFGKKEFFNDYFLDLQNFLGDKLQ